VLFRSGKGLADVNMDGLGVITDANGFYVAEVNAGWSGAVTPQKDGCWFDPNSRSYTNVALEQADQNYIVLPSDDFNDDSRGSMWRRKKM
jgi:hypothetical protein